MIHLIWAVELFVSCYDICTKIIGSFAFRTYSALCKNVFGANAWLGILDRRHLLFLYLHCNLFCFLFYLLLLPHCGSCCHEKKSIYNCQSIQNSLKHREMWFLADVRMCVFVCVCVCVCVFLLTFQTTVTHKRSQISSWNSAHQWTSHVLLFVMIFMKIDLRFEFYEIFSLLKNVSRSFNFCGIQAINLKCIVFCYNTCTKIIGSFTFRAYSALCKNVFGVNAWLGILDRRRLYYYIFIAICFVFSFPSFCFLLLPHCGSCYHGKKLNI